MNLTNNTLAFIIIFIVSFFLGCFVRRISFKCCNDSKNDKLDNLSDLALAAKMAGYNLNDLQIIEGIGPKIEKLLIDANIDTWEKLSETDIQILKKILWNAGDRYKFHDPSTWPEQAELARYGNFDELKEYQDYLNKGRELFS